MNPSAPCAKVQDPSAVVQFWNGERFTFHPVSEPIKRRLNLYSIQRKRAVR